MKKTKQVLVGLVTFMSGSLAYADRVEVAVETLLAPTVGYEQKNNIQVVLYGELPNKCYSLDEYQVEKSADLKIVRVRQYAQREDSGMCADPAHLPEDWKTPVPFTTEVSVGHLEVGSVNFIYQRSDRSLGERLVHVAPNTTLSVDSLPYAAISNVGVADVINGTRDIQVTLSGVLNSSCTVLDDQVKVDQESDVFVLKPTVKTDRAAKCLQVLVPFTKRVNLGRATAGRYLIHARSMNGRSLNRVVLVSK